MRFDRCSYCQFHISELVILIRGICLLFAASTCSCLLLIVDCMLRSKQPDVCSEFGDMRFVLGQTFVVDRPSFFLKSIYWQTLLLLLTINLSVSRGEGGRGRSVCVCVHTCVRACMFVNDVYLGEGYRVLRGSARVRARQCCMKKIGLCTKQANRLLLVKILAPLFCLSSICLLLFFFLWLRWWVMMMMMMTMIKWWR